MKIKKGLNTRYRLINIMAKSKNKELYLALVFFTIAFIIIGFFFIYPFSTSLILGTAISAQNQVSTQLREVKYPLISYLVDKPLVITTQAEENSPVVDIKYTIYQGEKVIFEGFANQQKINFIAVKLPYSAYGYPIGNVSVEIQNLTYSEGFKLGKE